MSWDGYLEILKGPDALGFFPVKEAAIWGMAAGKESKWASTAGLEGITEDEINKLAHDRSKFREVGAYIAGKKYMLLSDHLDNIDDYTMNLKSAKDAENNCFGVCVGKTTQALVIVMGKKDAQGGQLNDKVFKLVKYLRDLHM